jgi:hypothetical protein
MTNVSSLAARFARGHQDQVVVVQFAPTARIRIAKLEEIDGPIVIAMPAEWQDSLLPRVNLNERVLDEHAGRASCPAFRHSRTGSSPNQGIAEELREIFPSTRPACGELGW